MVKHPCPHCGEATISGLRRACLGPALPTKCSSCGRKVGVPWWSLVVILPWLLALVIQYELIEGGLLSFALGAMGALGMMLLFAALVPLVKK